MAGLVSTVTRRGRWVPRGSSSSDDFLAGLTLFPQKIEIGFEFVLALNIQIGCQLNYFLHRMNLASKDSYMVGEAGPTRIHSNIKASKSLPCSL